MGNPVSRAEHVIFPTRAGIRFLAVLVLVIAGGSRSAGIEKNSETEAGQKTNAPATSRNGDARYPGWLKVTTAPGELQKAARLADNEERNHLNAIVKQPDRVWPAIIKESVFGIDRESEEKFDALLQIG